jgi:hypothetical protein
MNNSSVRDDTSDILGDVEGAESKQRYKNVVSDSRRKYSGFFIG